MTYFISTSPTQQKYSTLARHELKHTGAVGTQRYMLSFSSNQELTPLRTYAPAPWELSLVGLKQ
jgi:hypothetical protein